jgi:sulfur carrier protein ThiS
MRYINMLLSLCRCGSEYARLSYSATIPHEQTEPAFTRNDRILKLTVKLYATLRRSFTDYDHSSGLQVVLPEGSSINDLLAHLNLSPEGLGMIYMDGKPLTKNSLLLDGTQINIFQPIAGG